MPNSSGGLAALTVKRKIPAGTKIKHTDLEAIKIPDKYASKNLLGNTAEVADRLALIDLEPNNIITKPMILTSKTTSPNTAIVPVRLINKSMDSLLKVGDHISVIGLNTQGQPTILADDALIIALPVEERTNTFSTSHSTSSIIVVEVPKSKAVELSFIGNQHGVSVILR